MNITDPQTQSSISSIEVPSIESKEIGGQEDNQRILGRQIPSGNLRGDQTITGSLIVNNPSTNTTSMTLSGSNQNITFGDPAAPTITISGPDQTIAVGPPADPVITVSGVSQSITVKDPVTNITRVILGLLPDGTFGLAISKPGIDIYTAFS